MPSQKFFILFFLCSPFLTIAHPFYKTMPKEVEHIYDELKNIERECIESIKKTFPKIPSSCWDNVFLIEKQIQIWLRDTAPVNLDIKEPRISTNCSKRKLKKYISHYIEYICIKHNIDFKKIDLKNKSFAKTAVLAEAAGPNVVLYKNEETVTYDIDLSGKCVITVDLKKVTKQRNFYIRYTLQHELFHITEGHYTKSKFIYNLILHYYTLEDVAEFNLLNLRLIIQELKKIQELIADILPALVSPQYAIECFQSINLSHSGDATHPSSTIIAEWLKKILAALHLANKSIT